MISKPNAHQNHPGDLFNIREISGVKAKSADLKCTGAGTRKKHTAGILIFRQIPGSNWEAAALGVLQGPGVSVPLAPGCAKCDLWRSPLQTVYFQIHLLGLGEPRRLRWMLLFISISLLPNLIITTTRCDRLPLKPI
jgi:hypothetical protein